MTQGTLTIEGLGKRWPDGSRALEDVTLDVEAGTTLAILGSSGAGKSTLLRLVAGFERPDEGTIRLGTETLAGDGVCLAPELRGVGMVFQALELWSHMTVAEHVAFGLPGRPRGRRAASHPAVQDLAAAVGLPAPLLVRRPETLSGGEQQRVAIARTLAAQPAVILYDEPLANLDPDRRATIRRLIRRLALEHGTTLLYVTHDPQEALELGDTVAVFSEGRLVEHGTPVGVYREPKTLLGAQALGPVSALPGVVTAGSVTTPLGVHPTTAPDGACMALWRPEGVQADPAAGMRAHVVEVTPRGADWSFHATVEGMRVQGHSHQPLEAGHEIGLRALQPAACLPAAPSRETA